MTCKTKSDRRGQGVTNGVTAAEVSRCPAGTIPTQRLSKRRSNSLSLVIFADAGADSKSSAGQDRPGRLAEGIDPGEEKRIRALMIRQKDRLAGGLSTSKCGDDQPAIDAALRDVRYPAKPRPAKPSIIIAQVEGSGVANAKPPALV
jgi:hypothetical protein